MAQKGIEMVRYADDFVVLCRSEAAAQEALERVRVWTAAAGLMLHPVKTRMVDATQDGGFDFLGYRFAAGQRWPRRKSLDKLSETIRAQTRRVSGQNLQAIITDLNRTLRGWFEYFQHRHRFTFIALDKGVRMRLRSTLRFRQGRQGRGRGSDHQRWPNAFFARQGLFSLTAAHRLACQSSGR
jgi:RNA-directed DNA polymerase